MIRPHVAMAAVLLLGCSHQLYSPPTRSLPLESMASAGRGRSGIAIEGAAHAVSIPFSYSAASGNARFRHGVAKDVDVSLEGQVIDIGGEPAANIDTAIYSLRIGAKYEASAAFAVTGGYGFGVHAGGTFMSPDVGFLTGWENPYAVPFFGARVFLSVPVRSHAVDTSAADEPLGSYVATPRTTGGFGSVLGLRVPIPPGFAPKEGVRGSLIGGLGTTFLATQREAAIAVSLGGGAEIEF